jgi:hypothetical protein
MPSANCVPHTGYGRANSIAQEGNAPQRMYSHGMGGSDKFYGKQFKSDGRDVGQTHTMAQGPRGRVVPYNVEQGKAIAKNKNKDKKK